MKTCNNSFNIYAITPPKIFNIKLNTKMLLSGKVEFEHQYCSTVKFWVRSLQENSPVGHKE
ncbi:hypothetical protein VF14_27590 [Nostoc linckia z18]|uniref:Uncharacterized protein n=2 Tax=Nostoc linckia TaxID=92942 RepID=A0A9Q5Z7T2_NOSLI|nr:hypothetical protein VF03_33890 [Nostoc linckia z2]PHJ61441.1 hypothetical protein VF02_19960 [Nostoc linckia z1]PHJ65374.1 hypothetical protein VF05_21070 [Nostoc linckia z3]PHJ78468.1 hypothetical protein VF07_35225 [Nostoc linckia z6]PHJ81016.1 hypothetical protein VF06_20865 [Nostoc linckia z4]PHJ91632.1 hypothetical protein VF04_29475 [Nostoc linckia z7]PHJ98218.1 hypothetical protein VF08_27340 [Nostoc linckia z8]PHK06664.1 hypothetical protein VF09_24835 [Nostoc linckia z9]PHK1666